MCARVWLIYRDSHTSSYTDFLALIQARPLWGGAPDIFCEQHSSERSSLPLTHMSL